MRIFDLTGQFGWVRLTGATRVDFLHRMSTNHLLGLQAASLNKGNDAFSAKEYDKAIALYGNSERIAKACAKEIALMGYTY